MRRSVAILLWSLCANGFAHAQAAAPVRVTSAQQQADRALAALARDSTNVDQLSWAAQSLMVAGDPETAFPYLQKLLTLDKPPTYRTAMALRLLGEVYFMRGDYIDAKQELDRALLRDTISIAPHFDEMILGYDSVYRQWTIYETPHFRFHVSPSSGVSDIPKFASAREAALRPILNILPSTTIARKKIDLFVWSSAEEARHLGLPVQLSYPSPTLSVAHVLVSQPPGHELAHVVLWRAVAPVAANGLAYYGPAAMFEEPGRDLKSEARRAVRAAGISPVDIRGLWQDWHRYPDAVATPIAAAFLTEVLHRGGRDRFLALLHDPRLEAADRLYGSDLQVWIDDFQRGMRPY